MTKILSVEEILGAPDIREEVVEVPEWGGAVRIRAFTKAQQQAIRDDATLKANTRDGKAGTLDTSRLEMLTLIRGIVEPKFQDAHILNLREKSSSAIERILKAILVLSGMAENAVEQAEATFPRGPGA